MPIAFRNSLPAALCALALLTCACRGADPADKPADPARPDASKLPHLTVDVKKKELRIDAEFVNAQMPLEFFCCINGTAEHETVIRSPVKPSHVHLGMLMLGLAPGEPVHYSKAADKWLAPHGPPINISCEWTDPKTQKTVRYPAYRLMRGVKNKKEMPPMTWIFAGSRVMEDGKYAADTTGYLVSVVNFDLTVIDIPELASSSNDSLEWEFNPDLCPPKGTPLTMIFEPLGKDDPAIKKADANTGAAGAGGASSALAAPGDPPAATPAAIDSPPAAGQATDAAKPDKSQRLSDVEIDAQKVKALRERWEKVIRPRNAALKEAAQAHYEVINSLRKEQNRLIDEADRIQRVIDQLQKEYQDLTTPQPDTDAKEKPANP